MNRIDLRILTVNQTKKTKKSKWCSLISAVSEIFGTKMKSKKHGKKRHKSMIHFMMASYYILFKSILEKKSEKQILCKPNYKKKKKDCLYMYNNIYLHIYL